MHNASRSQSSQGRSKRLSFVKEEFRRGYTFEGIPWQTNGYVTGSLWNTRDHIIRIIPGYDPQTREIFRQNINVNEYSDEADPADYLSDTFMMADTVQGFGSSRSSFVTSYKPGTQDEMTYGGDTVIAVFARNVFRSCNPSGNKKPRFGVIPEMRTWCALKDGTLPLPRQALLVQALLFWYQGGRLRDENGDELMSEDGEMVPKMGVVALEGRMTLQGVMRALTEPKDPSLPLDAVTNSKWGGLAELQGNKLFLNHVLKNDGKKQVNALNPSVQSGSKGWNPTPLDLAPENCYNWWTPWEQLISYMTAEEQAILLATEFGADAVNYLVGTDPIYHGFNMPEQVAQAGYGRFTKFTDGVKEVGQRSYATVPAEGSAPKSALKRETPLASAFGGLKPVTGKVASALGKPVTAGVSIPKNSGVSMSDFNSALSQIRKAAAKPVQQEENDHASMADAVLNEEDLDDYQVDPDQLPDEGTEDEQTF